MSGLPWVRFFPSDWLAGTRGMSAAETGIYITLVATMYERREPVPEHHERLARLCGTTVAAFARALDSLVAEGKVTRSPEGLFNRKVAEELRIRDEKSDGASQSAKIRWQQKANEIKPTAMRPQSDRNANQNQNQNKEVDTNVSTKKNPKPATPREWLLTSLDEDHADAVLEHRQRSRKPLTVRGAQLLAGKFAECPDANQAADLMVLNGWQGCEPAWVARHLEEAGRSARPHRQPTLSEAFGAIARMETRDDLDSNPAGAIVLDLPALRHN